MSAMTLAFDLMTSLYKPALEHNKFLIFHTWILEKISFHKIKIYISQILISLIPYA